MRNLGIFLLSFAIYFSISTSVLADQYGPYQGPGPNLSIVVDKLVGVPTESKGGEVTYSYVDNLGVNDFKFKAENIVFFKIKVKNTSNTNLEGVVLKDTAPSYVDLLENPGTWDSSNRVLTINVGPIMTNEEKEYIVRGKVTTLENLPAQGITCVVNRAIASNSKVSDDDTAQLCIETPVLGQSTSSTSSVPATTNIPKTGPEAGMVMLPLAGAIAFLGKKLRKYS